MRIHPVFYITLLELAPKNFRIVTSLPVEANDADSYKIEEIIGMRWKDKTKILLIKWLGYRDEYNTWEPYNNLYLEAKKDLE